MGNTRKSKTQPWRCPKCNAPAGKHGKSGREGCIGGYHEYCDGLICECMESLESEAKDHGTVNTNPCDNASCYHCGWGGTMPPDTISKDKLKGWALRAWNEGWRPPIGYTLPPDAKKGKQ